jgi:hypothetical protein
LTYYFSTHGWSRVESSLLSPALSLELLDAAAAAARALLLKKEAAIVIELPESGKSQGYLESWSAMC